MAAKLDCRWHLRQIMATRGMFSTTVAPNKPCGEYVVKCPAEEMTDHLFTQLEGHGIA
jgi:hypothetical protein